MNQKTLIGLGIASTIAVIAALVINHSRKPVSDLSAQAAELAPGLRDHVNEVSKLSVTGGNNQTLTTLERTDAGWKVVEKGGYPADVGKLREYLLKLADASLVERKTSNPERYADLGVSDMSAPSASGLLVTLEGLPAPTKFIVGNFDGQTNGTFVRRSDDAQSWLAKGSLIPEKSSSHWLRKEIADVPASRIASVEITRPNGKVLRLSKQNAEQASFTIADLPKGRTPISEFAANGPGSVLADLNLEDVAPSKEVAPPEDAIKLRYATFDGVIVDATSWMVGEKRYTTFKASLDSAKAKRHIEEEMALPSDEKAQADGEHPTSSDAAEKADPAADSAQRLAGLEAEVVRLNAAFDGWSFVLPGHKNANIDKSIDDLLAPIEEKAGKSGKGGS